MFWNFVLQLVLVVALVMLMLPVYEWACDRGVTYMICGFAVGFVLYHSWKSIAGEINYFALLPGILIALALHEQAKILLLRWTWKDE